MSLRTNKHTSLIAYVMKASASKFKTMTVCCDNVADWLIQFIIVLYCLQFS